MVPGAVVFSEMRSPQPGILDPSRSHWPGARNWACSVFREEAFNLRKVSRWVHLHSQDGILDSQSSPELQMTTPPEKPDPKMKSGSLPPALRSGLSIALFLFLVVLVSYLSLNFLLALVDKLS